MKSDEAVIGVVEEATEDEAKGIEIKGKMFPYMTRTR